VAGGIGVNLEAFGSVGVVRRSEEPRAQRDRLRPCRTITSPTGLLQVSVGRRRSAEARAEHVRGPGPVQAGNGVIACAFLHELIELGHVLLQAPGRDHDQQPARAAPMLK